MNICGLIMARGGSKGIPRKNIKELNGIPLLGYVAKAADESFSLNEVWVSSEDPEILQVCGRFPWLKKHERPKELAEDDTPSVEVAKDFLSKHDVDVLVILNACCPLTSARDIDWATFLYTVNKKPVVSMVEDFSAHPSKVLVDGKCLGDFDVSTRQKLPQVLKRNTAIYITTLEYIKKHDRLFGEDTTPYIMSPEKSFDINTMWDWKLAELIIKELSPE